MRLMISLLGWFVGILVLNAQVSVEVSRQGIDKAERLIAAGEYDRAIEVLEDLMTRGSSEDALALLGKAYLLKGDTVSMIKQVEAYLKKHRKSLTAWILKYVVTPDKKRKKILKTIADLLPDDPAQIAKYGRFAEELMQWDLAVFMYQKGEEKVGEGAFMLDITRVYERQGRWYEVAKTYLEQLNREPAFMPAVEDLMRQWVSDSLKRRAFSLALNTMLSRSASDKVWEVAVLWYAATGDVARALKFAIALDEKKGTRGKKVYDFAKKWEQEGLLDAALKAYEWVEENGAGPYKWMARERKLKIRKDILFNSSEYKPEVARQLALDYAELLRNRVTPQTVKDFAYIIGVYLKMPDSAISILEKYNTWFRHKKDLRYEYHLTKGDIYFANGLLSEAILEYMQAEREAPDLEKSLEARYKLAESAFANGDFGWALYQLELIAGGPSRYQTNDALSLIQFIKEYRNDSLALSYYAKAWYAYKLQDSMLFKAYVDSTLREAQFSSLKDELKYLEALFEKNIKGNPEKAYEILVEMVEANPQLLLADDALYQLILLDLERENAESALDWFSKLSQLHGDSPYKLLAGEHLRRSGLP
ncbi:MAG: hypothetical protein GXO48_05770 [Chlorobi bacterium]|nr:hypothetical protein [Chlorobiota bacterium]